MGSLNPGQCFARFQKFSGRGLHSGEPPGTIGHLWGISTWPGSGCGLELILALSCPREVIAGLVDVKLDPVLEYSTSNFTAMLFYTEVGDILRNASHTPLKCHLVFLRVVSKPLSRKITELKKIVIN